MVTKGKVMHITEVKDVQKKDKMHQYCTIVLSTKDGSEIALNLYNKSISQLVGVTVGSYVRVEFFTSVFQLDDRLLNNFYVRTVDIIEPGTGRVAID